MSETSNQSFADASGAPPRAALHWPAGMLAGNVEGCLEPALYDFGDRIFVVCMGTALYCFQACIEASSPSCRVRA